MTRRKISAIGSSRLSQLEKPTAARDQSVGKRHERENVKKSKQYHHQFSAMIAGKHTITAIDRFYSQHNSF